VTDGLSAEARLDILGLYARYCHGFDTADSDMVASCFTEDCVYETGRATHRGRAAVRRYVAELAAEMPSQRHQTTDALVQAIPGQPGRARGRAYYTFSVITDGTLTTVLTGVYENEFLEVDGRWHIHRHRGLADRPAVTEG
jgi:uncharacterized protein (TIGR02246 family)